MSHWHPSLRDADLKRAFNIGISKEIKFQGPLGTFSCQADLASVGNVVKFTYTSASDCENEVDDVQWRLDEDGLHLQLMAIKNAPSVENKAVYEAKRWQKVK